MAQGPGGAASRLYSVSYFLVSIPGISDEVGMFMECHGLEMSFEVYEYAEGGNNFFNHHFPGRLRYPHLVLTRGMTQSDALFKWFTATRKKAELKEVKLSLREQGKSQDLRTWTFAEAFPVRWVGPTFQAGSTASATETLEIAHHGLQGIEG